MIIAIGNMIGGMGSGGGGGSIPSDAVIEPDGVTALKEPNGDYVLEP